MRPSSGRCRPSSMPSRVVLPAPFAPSSPVTPWADDDRGPAERGRRPHRLTMPAVRITAVVARRRERAGRCRSSTAKPTPCSCRASTRPTLQRMTDEGQPVDIKPRSCEVTDGFERAPARAMLRAVGMTDDDWDKPQVGVASSWNEVTPCNLPLDRLAKRAKEGVRAAGGFPIEFTTIAVSDGISMGHEGMRASLVSREIIADSVETVMHAERFDALRHLRRLRQVAARHAHGRRPAQPAVGVPLRRLDPARPSATARRSTSCRVFEAVGARAAGADRRASSTRSSATPARPRAPAPACSPPTRWRRSAEAIGMSLPGSSSPPAVDRRRDDFAFASRRGGHRGCWSPASGPARS